MGFAPALRATRAPAVANDSCFTWTASRAESATDIFKNLQSILALGAYGDSNSTKSVGRKESKIA